MGIMDVRYDKDLEDGCDHTFTLWTLVDGGELVETAGLLVQTSVAHLIYFSTLFLLLKNKKISSS